MKRKLIKDKALDKVLSQLSSDVDPSLSPSKDSSIEETKKSKRKKDKHAKRSKHTPPQLSEMDGEEHPTSLDSSSSSLINRVRQQIESTRKSVEEKRKKLKEDFLKNKKVVGKKGELKEKPKKGSGLDEPHTDNTPNPGFGAHSEQIAKIPTNPRELNRNILSYLNKLQHLALSRAENMLKNPEFLSSPNELVKLVASLKDLQLTMKWTRKLEKVILESPNKLLPPGSTSGGWKLLNKVRELSSTVKKEQKKDERLSGQKSTNVNKHLGSLGVELPDEKTG